MEQRQNDSVDKYFKAGLSGLNATPDDALWAGIESGLDQPKTANSNVWRWLVVLIPAIGCASMLWFASTTANRAMAMEMAYNEKAELLDSLVKVIDLNVQNQRSSKAFTDGSNDSFENSKSDKATSSKVMASTAKDQLKTDNLTSQLIGSKNDNRNENKSSPENNENLSLDNSGFSNGVEQNGSEISLVSNRKNIEESPKKVNLIHQNGEKTSNQASGLMRQNSKDKLIFGSLSLINRKPFSVKQNFYQSSLLGEVQNIDFPCDGGYSTPWFFEFSPNWNFSQRIFGKGDPAEWSSSMNDGATSGGIATFNETNTNSANTDIESSIKVSETLQSALGFSTAIGRKVGSRFELSLGVDFYRWKMKQSNGSNVAFEFSSLDLSPNDVYIEDGTSLFGSFGSQEIDFVNDYYPEEALEETVVNEPFRYEVKNKLSFISIPLKLRFYASDLISFNVGFAYSRLLSHEQELVSFEPQEVFTNRLRMVSQTGVFAAQLGVRVNALTTEKFSLFVELGDEFQLNPIHSSYYYRTFLARSFVGFGIKYSFTKKCR